MHVLAPEDTAEANDAARDISRRTIVPDVAEGLQDAGQVGLFTDLEALDATQVDPHGVEPDRATIWPSRMDTVRRVTRHAQKPPITAQMTLNTNRK
jgi:hypothetical protein